LSDSEAVAEGKNISAKRKFTTVSIPISLYNRIKKLIEGTGFTSVSDYVTYILREIVAMHEAEKAAEPFSPEDIEKIKEKLKALGYLD